MRLRGIFALAIAAWCIATAACGEGDDAEPTSAPGTPAATTEPSPPSDGSPSPGATGTPGERDISSGIRSVDEAVAAVLDADEALLREMVVFQPVPCVVEQMGLGAPPLCRQGEADGTPVEVLPSAQCEGFYVRPDELQLNSIVSPENELYAIYRAPAEYFPSGTYTAVFRYGEDTQPPRDAFEVILDNEGVVGINYGCAEDPEQLVETRALTDAIVPPE